MPLSTSLVDISNARSEMREGLGSLALLGMTTILTVIDVQVFAWVSWDLYYHDALTLLDINGDGRSRELCTAQ